MPFKFNEVYQNIAKINQDTFIDIKVGQKEGQGKTYYLDYFYNKNFATDLAPKYLKLMFIELEKNDEWNYSFITEGQYSGKDGIKRYHGIKFIDSACPKVIEFMQFLDTCILNAYNRLRKMYETNKPTSVADTAVYRCIKSVEDFEASYKPLVPVSYVDKKTGEKIIVTDLSVSFSFDFNTWGDKMSKELAGKQKTRIMFEKSEEELEAAPENKKHLLYKPVFLDETLNTPKEVIKYNAGLIYGKMIFPGSVYCKGGEINTKPAIGLAIIVPDPESAGGRNDLDSLCDEEVEDAIKSHSANNSRKPKKSRKTDSDDDDFVEAIAEEKKPKKSEKKAPAKKKEESSDESSDDSSEEESEDEKKSKKSEKNEKSEKNKKKESTTNSKTKAKASVSESEDSDEESEESEEEDKKPVKSSKKSGSKK